MAKIIILISALVILKKRRKEKNSKHVIKKHFPSYLFIIKVINDNNKENENFRGNF